MFEKFNKKYLLIFIFLIIVMMIIPASFAEDTSDINQTNDINQHQPGPG